MFYSKPRRAVAYLFGVLDNHSPICLLEFTFWKAKMKKKKKKILEVDQTNPLSGDRGQIRCLPVDAVALKKSRVRSRDELKCHCAVRLMSQCCRALLELLASHRLHHCRRAQEPLTVFRGRPSCRFLLTALRLIPEILRAAENKSDLPEFRLEIPAILFIFKAANLRTKKKKKDWLVT